MRLSRSDRAVLVVSALAWFIPEQHGVYLATTLAGGWLVTRPRPDRHWMGIGQIWLALSIYELWGKLVFKILYQSIEGAEIGLIYRIGHLVYPASGRTAPASASAVTGRSSSSKDARRSTICRWPFWSGSPS